MRQITCSHSETLLPMLQIIYLKVLLMSVHWISGPLDAAAWEVHSSAVQKDNNFTEGCSLISDIRSHEM